MRVNELRQRPNVDANDSGESFLLPSPRPRRFNPCPLVECFYFRNDNTGYSMPSASMPWDQWLTCLDDPMVQSLVVSTSRTRIRHSPDRRCQRPSRPFSGTRIKTSIILHRPVL